MTLNVSTRSSKVKVHWTLSGLTQKSRFCCCCTTCLELSDRVHY